MSEQHAAAADADRAALVAELASSSGRPASYYDEWTTGAVLNTLVSYYGYGG